MENKKNELMEIVEYYLENSYKEKFFKLIYWLTVIGLIVGIGVRVVIAILTFLVSQQII